MKKYVSFLMAMAILAASVCGMGGASVVSASEDSIQIVATIFPEYDWVKQILGEKTENVELTMLLDSGVDLHNYQPTVNDILTISNCDLFIYVGGESDDWVDDVLAEAVNEDMVVIDLMDVLGDMHVEEQTVQDMIAEYKAGEDEEEDGKPALESAGQRGL
ncbi:MAG: metal ABC transporter substrate-binding protein, partial [Lachnospiraceae bacterium]|nr:metal ABC transporter substrate-binding protein [Lachnospiraceae bacterium]